MTVCAGTAAVVVQAISKSFADRRLGSKLAVHRLSFTVNGGEIVGIFGASGCGKTTLLRIICGVLHQDEGEVYLFGSPASERRGKVAYVSQYGGLLEWKTLWNNALLGWSIVEPNQSLSREAVASRAEQLFNSFGITDQMHKYPSQCSGGQRQRAALIRALLTPVNILALDEPGGAIDHIARVKIYEALLQVVQEGACASGNVAALIVSHDPEELLLLCDRVLVIPGQCATTMTSVPITFARPRDKEIRFKPEFSELKRKLWNCLL